MSSEQPADDEVIEHDPIAEEHDLLTTLEANARVRELLRDTRRELVELTASGAGDLEVAHLKEKVAQIEAAIRRYPGSGS
ncbi:hypothetical protein N602_25070 [Mycobacterium avium subsp. hominissuis 10-5606]|nr:hypothetical protein N602_25070 [Mycobacterium avium subsp. hominissuis 10-5606]